MNSEEELSTEKLCEAIARMEEDLELDKARRDLDKLC